MLLGMSHLFSGGAGSELFGDLLWEDRWVGGRGAKYKQSLEKRREERVVYFVSHIVCMCVCWEGGRGSEFFHLSSCFRNV